MIDDLYNGATGNIIGAEYNVKGELDYIVVRFDDKNSGKILRSNHKDIAEKHSGKFFRLDIENIKSNSRVSPKLKNIYIVSINFIKFSIN